MNPALRTELRKLRRTRGLLALPVGGVAVAAVTSAILLAIAEPDEIARRLSEHGPLRFGPTNFGLLLVLFGVRLFTDEVQHRTLASSLIRMPDRRALVVAKVLVAAATAGVFCIAVAALVVPITVVGVGARDLDMTYDVAATAALVVRVTAASSLMAVLGVVFGVVVGNRTVALVAALGWSALAEDLVGALLHVDRYLPGEAMRQLVGGEGRGAAVLLAAVAVTAGAASASIRRDIA